MGAQFESGSLGATVITRIYSNMFHLQGQDTDQDMDIIKDVTSAGLGDKALQAWEIRSGKFHIL